MHCQNAKCYVKKHYNIFYIIYRRKQIGCDRISLYCRTGMYGGYFMAVNLSISLEEMQSDISTLTYNWNLVKICYEVWENDIVRAWKEERKLYLIAGVGENYINEMCSGRKIKTNRKFNAENYEDLVYYLRGDRKIIELKILYKYIVLNNIYNEINSRKRKKIDCNDINKWVANNVGENINFKEVLNSLKKDIIQGIGKASIIDGATGKPTSLGNLKNYLMGKGHKEVVTGEIEGYMAKLLDLIMQLDCNKISSMNEEQLRVFVGYSKQLYEKFHIESEGRRIKKEEVQLLGKIHEAMIQKQKEDIRKEDEEDLKKY